VRYECQAAIQEGKKQFFIVTMSGDRAVEG
jgi:hypothetical protein